MKHQVSYIHALGWRWLNRAYDPLIRLAMPEQRFKRRLVERARLEPGHRLLDLGGSPHTLLMRIAAQSVALFDGRGVVADNLAGRLPQFCLEAGFADASDDERWPTAFGTLAFHRAVKPETL